MLNQKPQLMSEDDKMDTLLELIKEGSGLMQELDFDNTLNDSDKSFKDNVKDSR